MSGRAFNITARLNLRLAANVKDIRKDIEQKLSNLTPVPIKIRAQVSNLKQLRSDISSKIGLVPINIKLNVDKRISQQIGSLNASVPKLTQNIRSLNSAGLTLNKTFATLAVTMQNFKNAGQNLRVGQTLNQVNKQANATSSAMSGASVATAGFASEIGIALRRFTAFAAGATGFLAVLQQVKKGISEAIEFQNELVRLGQVVDKPLSQLGPFKDLINELSTGLGVSSNELSKVATTIAQAGFKLSETQAIVKAIAKTDLAPTFDSMAETAEGAIAILRQFDISANKLESTLSSLNAVSAAFAVESSDVIDAVKRAGGAFRTSGGNFNQFIALFTAVRDTTRQSAETIATSFNTIFTRLQRPQTLEFLRDLNIELENIDGTFVGPFEAVRRLSEGLSSLNTQDTRYAQIAEVLGGYRQIPRLLPLIQNFSKAQQAYNVALAGSNSLNKDAAASSSSFQRQITKLREEFFALIRTISEDKGIREFAGLMLESTRAVIQLAQALTPLTSQLALLASFKIAGSIGNFAKGLGTRGATRPIGRNSGGPIPGVGNTDKIPAMLTPGEYVMTKEATNRIGVGELDRLNYQGYNSGGIVKKILSLLGKKKASSKSSRGFSNNFYDIDRLRGVDPSIMEYRNLLNMEKLGRVPKGTSDSFFDNNIGSRFSGTKSLSGLGGKESNSFDSPTQVLRGINRRIRLRGYNKGGEVFGFNDGGDTNRYRLARKSRRKTYRDKKVRPITDEVFSLSESNQNIIPDNRFFIKGKTTPLGHDGYSLSEPKLTQIDLSNVRRLKAKARKREQTYGVLDSNKDYANDVRFGKTVRPGYSGDFNLESPVNTQLGNDGYTGSGFSPPKQQVPQPPGPPPITLSDRPTQKRKGLPKPKSPSLGARISNRFDSLYAGARNSVGGFSYSGAKAFLTQPRSFPFGGGGGGVIPPAGGGVGGVIPPGGGGPGVPGGGKFGRFGGFKGGGLIGIAASLAAPAIGEGVASVTNKNVGNFTKNALTYGGLGASFGPQAAAAGVAFGTLVTAVQSFTDEMAAVKVEELEQSISGAAESIDSIFSSENFNLESFGAVGRKINSIAQSIPELESQRVVANRGTINSARLGSEGTTFSNILEGALGAFGFETAADIRNNEAKTVRDETFRRQLDLGGKAEFSISRFKDEAVKNRLGLTKENLFESGLTQQQVDLAAKSRASVSGKSTKDEAESLIKEILDYVKRGGLSEAENKLKELAETSIKAENALRLFEVGVTKASQVLATRSLFVDSAKNNFDNLFDGDFVSTTRNSILKNPEQFTQKAFEENVRNVSPNEQLTNNVVDADILRRELPGILDRLSKESALTNFSDTINAQLTGAGISQQNIGKFGGKIAEIVQGLSNSRGGEREVDNIKEALIQNQKDIIDQVSGSRLGGGGLDALVQRDEEQIKLAQIQIDVLNKIFEVDSSIRDSQERADSIRFERRRIQAGFTGQLAGPDGASKAIERLAGTTDVGQIEKQLLSTIRKIPQAEGRERTELQETYRRLFEALNRLSDAAGLASADLEKLQEVTSKREAISSLRNSYLSSGTEGRIGFVRDAQLAFAAKQRGSLDGFSPEDQGRIVSILTGPLKELTKVNGENLIDVLGRNTNDPVVKLLTEAESKLQAKQEEAQQAILAAYDRAIAAANANTTALEAQKTALNAFGKDIVNGQRTAIENNTKALQDLTKGIGGEGFGSGREMSTGGPVYLARGGKPRGTDTVPAMLTPGEFVVNKKSTSKYRGLLEMLNRSKLSSSFDRIFEQIISGNVSKGPFNLPYKPHEDNGSKGPFNLPYKGLTPGYGRLQYLAKGGALQVPLPGGKGTESYDEFVKRREQIRKRKQKSAEFKVGFFQSGINKDKNKPLTAPLSPGVSGPEEKYDNFVKRRNQSISERKLQAETLIDNQKTFGGPTIPRDKPIRGDTLGRIARPDGENRATIGRAKGNIESRNTFLKNRRATERQSLRDNKANDLESRREEKRNRGQFTSPEAPQTPKSKDTSGGPQAPGGVNLTEFDKRMQTFNENLTKLNGIEITLKVQDIKVDLTGAEALKQMTDSLKSIVGNAIIEKINKELLPEGNKKVTGM